MSLEGELQVGLVVDAGRVTRVEIVSSRPDVAHALLTGRHRAEIAAAVPRVFAVCGSSQAVASTLACAAAAGDDIGEELLARCRDRVAGEMRRDATWRCLLEWPRWIGEVPGHAAIEAGRKALQGDGAAVDGTDDGARLLFGMSAADWLAVDTPGLVKAWCKQGPSAAARFIQRALLDDQGDACLTAADAGATTPLLSARLHPDRIAGWALLAAQDPDFARHPSWDGHPAETGALARQQHDPLVAAVMQRSATRLPARWLARLRELAMLMLDRHRPAVGALRLPTGEGLAWVENARGLLVHQVMLAREHAYSYRIVAPTEWNFHPAGPLARALTGADADEAVVLRDAAQRLVRSLDPCVACRVEVRHA